MSRPFDDENERCYRSAQVMETGRSRRDAVGAGQPAAADASARGASTRRSTGGTRSRAGTRTRCKEVAYASWEEVPAARGAVARARQARSRSVLRSGECADALPGTGPLPELQRTPSPRARGQAGRVESSGSAPRPRLRLEAHGG